MATFPNKILIGLQKIRDIIASLIDTHNSSTSAHDNHFTDANAHAANINGRISTHNLNITAHPNGFKHCVKITSNESLESPTTNNTHKDIGDVSFLSNNGTTIANVGVDTARDSTGNVFRIIYMQVLSDTTDQNKHATIALKVTPSGGNKIIHSDATFQTISTDRCTATTPTANIHIANKKYVDDKISTISTQLAEKAPTNHTHDTSYNKSFFYEDTVSTGYRTCTMTETFTNDNGSSTQYLATLTFYASADANTAPMLVPEGINIEKIVSISYSGTSSYNRKGRAYVSSWTATSVTVDITGEIPRLSTSECVTVVAKAKFV